MSAIEQVDRVPERIGATEKIVTLCTNAAAIADIWCKNAAIKDEVFLTQFAELLKKLWMTGQELGHNVQLRELDKMTLAEAEMTIRGVEGV